MIEAPDDATVLLVALKQEAAALLGRLELRRAASWPDAGATAAAGRLAGSSVLVVLTGVGPERARRAANHCARLAASGRCRRVLWLGVAGGLSPELAAGDLMVATEVTAPGEAPLPLDADIVRAASREGCLPGLLLTVPAVAATAQEKAKLYEQAGGRRPTAVDMESWHAAQVLAEAHVPFGAVRSISDSAAENLPSALWKSTDERGQINVLPLLGQALRRPRTLARLESLRRNVAKGSRRLADIAARLV